MTVSENDRNFASDLQRATSVAVALLCITCSSAAQEKIVSFKKQIQPILNVNCVYCHITGAMQGGLTLEPGLSYKSLVSVKSTQSVAMSLVEPGKPNESYIFHKIMGTHVKAGGTGASMPFSAEVPIKLEAKDLQLIERWIAGGAHNN